MKFTEHEITRDLVSGEPAPRLILRAGCGVVALVVDVVPCSPGGVPVFHMQWDMWLELDDVKAAMDLAHEWMKGISNA